MHAINPAEPKPDVMRQIHCRNGGVFRCLFSVGLGQVCIKDSVGRYEFPMQIGPTPALIPLLCGGANTNVQPRLDFMNMGQDASIEFLFRYSPLTTTIFPR